VGICICICMCMCICIWEYIYIYIMLVHIQLYPINACCAFFVSINFLVIPRQTGYLFPRSLGILGRFVRVLTRAPIRNTPSTVPNMCSYHGIIQYLLWYPRNIPWAEKSRHPTPGPKLSPRKVRCQAMTLQMSNDQLRPDILRSFASKFFFWGRRWNK